MNKKIFFLLVFLLCLLFPKFSMAQFDLVHTNLTGLSTGNLNMEGSMFFSMRWSAHFPVQYSPFNLWGDAKLKKHHPCSGHPLLDERILCRRLFLRVARHIFPV
nr:DUF3575 domain-containing protein [Bacteroides pyogenes]